MFPFLLDILALSWDGTDFILLAGPGRVTGIRRQEMYKPRWCMYLYMCVFKWLWLVLSRIEAHILRALMARWIRQHLNNEKNEILLSRTVYQMCAPVHWMWCCWTDWCGAALPGGVWVLCPLCILAHLSKLAAACFERSGFNPSGVFGFLPQQLGQAVFTL